MLTALWCTMCRRDDHSRIRDRRLRYLSGKPAFFRVCHWLINSRWFDWLIVAVVIGNTVTLSMDYYGIPQSTVYKLTLANIVFSTVFGAEMVLKNLGMGPRAYFSQYSNWFDALIVVTSFLEIGLGGECVCTRACVCVCVFATFGICCVLVAQRHGRS